MDGGLGFKRVRACDEDGGNGETGEGWKDKRDGRDRRGAYSEEEILG